MTKERAKEIIALAIKTDWSGAGLRDHMTADEQATITAFMYNAKCNMSFNDCVRQIAQHGRVL